METRNFRFQEPSHPACSLDCASCDHQAHTPPSTVAIDVTNLCNQRCPICLAYVEAMGYAYHPPLEYFEKIFKHFQHNDPRPNMCFFGGEPTMHKDFLKIVRWQDRTAFRCNCSPTALSWWTGITAVNCVPWDTGEFRVRRDPPEIYQTLRGDNSLAAKRKALENVVECGVNKLVMISTFATGVNDSNMAEMLDFIHDYREHVSVWGFVPLTPCWEPGKVALDPTTTECVEKVFEAMIPGIDSSQRV